MRGPTSSRAETLLRLATVTIVVDDYDRAIAWFRDVLGFRLVEDVPVGPDKRWVVVAASDQGARLLLAKAAGERQRSRIGDQTGGRVGFFLETPDFPAEHARLIAAGVVFLEDPRSEAYGMVAQFLDAWGNRWI